MTNDDQAAELANSNEAMRKAIETLSSDPDLVTFVGRILAIVAEHLHAPVVEYFSHEGPDSVKLRLTCRNGKVFVGSDIANDFRVAGFQVTPAVYRGEPNLFDRRSYFIRGDLLEHDGKSVEFWKSRGLDLPQWCMERGVRKTFNIGLHSGKKSFGSMLVHVPLEYEFTESRIALAVALAQQITLAIRMTELADESQRLAVTRERENSVGQRVAELAKSNEALRRGVERLSEDRRLESLLLSFIVESLKVLDADGGCILLPVKGTQSAFRIAAVYEHREVPVEEIEADPYQSINRELSDNAAKGVLAQFALNKTLAWRIEDIRSLAPFSYEYHRALGRKMLRFFPMRLRGHNIGFTAFALKHEHAPDDSARETVLALTQQVVLALELRRLSDESKRLAVAREKECAARKRASELIEVNSQLRQSLANFSEGRDFHQTVEQLLLSAARQMGSEGAYIFTCDDAEEMLQLVAFQDRQQSSRLNFQGYPVNAVPVDALPVCRHRLVNDPIRLIDARDAEDSEWFRDEARQWHIVQGRPLILAIPLTIGNRLLGCMLFSFSNQMKKADITADQQRLGQSFGALAAMSIEINHLAHRAQDAALAEERNRLAHDLHDALAGAFTGIYMQLQAASDLALAEVEKSRACLVRAEELARDGLRNVREFILSLTVNTQGQAPTVEGMQRLVMSVTACTPTAATFVVEGPEKPLRAIHCYALMHIVQEALGNAQRYAEARNIAVTLQFNSDSVSLCICDDGKGFLVDRVDDAGFGISGMRARAKRLSGHCRIESTPGYGTKIQVILPQPYQP